MILGFISSFFALLWRVFCIFLSLPLSLAPASMESGGLVLVSGIGIDAISSSLSLSICNGSWRSHFSISLSLCLCRSIVSSCPFLLTLHYLRCLAILIPLSISLFLSLCDYSRGSHGYGEEAASGHILYRVRSGRAVSS